MEPVSLAISAVSTGVLELGRVHTKLIMLE